MVIVVGSTVEELRASFQEVVEAGRVSTPLGVREEQEVAILACRKAREPIPQLWARLGPVWG